MKHGFSLTEVVVSISLFILLAGVGAGAYFRYYSFALINRDVIRVRNLISEARFLAQKNATFSDYGIHLDPSAKSVILFRDGYIPRQDGNKEVVLEHLDILRINLSPLFGTTHDILFLKQTGKTQNSGSFILGRNDYNYTFNINPQGVVE